MLLSRPKSPHFSCPSARLAPPVAQRKELRSRAFKVSTTLASSATDETGCLLNGLTAVAEFTAAGAAAAFGVGVGTEAGELA